jgi:hypothetical protein
MNNKDETSSSNADIIIFSILIPVVAGFVWYKDGFHTACATVVFFCGMFLYFNCFLNITLSLKYKTLEGLKTKLILSTIFSVLIFGVSYEFFGRIFTLKNLSYTAILFYSPDVFYFEVGKVVWLKGTPYFINFMVYPNHILNIQQFEIF